MEPIANFEKLEALYQVVEGWLLTHVFVVSNLVQLGAIVLLALLARRLAPPTRGWIERKREAHWGGQYLAGPLRVLGVIAFPLVWLLLQWLALMVAAATAWPHHLLVITVSLLSAWAMIRVLSTLIRNPAVARLVSLTAWGIAALNILGLLDPTVTLLDGLAVTLGDTRITALSLIKAFLSLTVMLWVATVISGVFEQRVRKAPNLTPSVQVLFAKLFKIAVLTLAVVAALNTVGIDLTAFAVFGGAIGVGLGFGLQKIVANLVSGIILLLDKSIKPGDVITVGNYYGWVNSLGARYVSVLTRDGIEHLIPNEEIITQRVENWSYSNSLVRLRKQIGVHYQSDVRKAIALCLEAASESTRVMAEPKPVCVMRDFGESSVDLELRFWIQDPQNGRANVTSEILLRVWDKFHANGIEIPYPQRDLHIRTPSNADQAIPLRHFDKAAEEC